MDWLFISRVAFLGFAVFWSIVNITRMYFKNSISFWNMLYQAIGITGFIATMGWISK